MIPRMNSLHEATYHTALSASLGSVVSGILGNPALGPLWSVLLALLVAIGNQWIRRLEGRKSLPPTDPTAAIDSTPGNLAVCVSCPHRPAAPPTRAPGVPPMPLLLMTLVVLLVGCTVADGQRVGSTIKLGGGWIDQLCRAEQSPVGQAVGSVIGATLDQITGQVRVIRDIPSSGSP